MTFSYGPGGEHSTTYLGQGKTPTRETLLKLARKHNINQAKEIIQEIQDVVKNFKYYVDKVELSSASCKSIDASLRSVRDEN